MKRNDGIDLLRIAAMVLVILLHLTGVGGICWGARLGSAQFYLGQFLRTASFCAVNCYALISGFVGWNRQPKLRNLLQLWRKVVLLCLVITGGAWVLDPAAVGLAEVREAVLPVLSGTYWYFSAYVGLFCFQPLLNHALRHIPGREAAMAAAGIGLLVLASSVGSLGEWVLLANGYSTLWLMILYLLGGLMSRFRIPERLPAAGWAGLYLLAVLAAYLPRMALLLIKPELWSFDSQNLAMQYTGPTVVLASVSLLGLFARLKLSPRAVRITRALSPHAFGVYLLHTNPLVFLGCIWGHFTDLGAMPLWKLVPTLLAVTLGIYAAGTAADWALSKGMKPLLKKTAAKVK